MIDMQSADIRLTADTPQALGALLVKVGNSLIDTVSNQEPPTEPENDGLYFMYKPTQQN